MKATQQKQDDGADLINLATRRPLNTSGTPNVVVSSTGNPAKPSQIMFDRAELTAILRIYGFKVAAGEWRDYTIDQRKDRAIFSVYRKAHEIPLYRIEKSPRLAKKQGAYSIIGANGAVLKRGRDLRQLLGLFEKQLKIVRWQAANSSKTLKTDILTFGKEGLATEIEAMMARLDLLANALINVVKIGTAEVTLYDLKESSVRHVRLAPESA